MYLAEADHLGSLTGLTDTAGVYVERYSYDAWGCRRISPLLFHHVRPLLRQEPGRKACSARHNRALCLCSETGMNYLHRYISQAVLRAA
jgi:hypothetical protein